MSYVMQGIMSIASMFLALFVLVFAITFLVRTQHHKNRHPWIFLLIGVIIFFLIQLFKVLELVGQIKLGDYAFYLDSAFIAVILFTFIFQYNLILNSELIQIKRTHEFHKALLQKKKTKKK